MVPFAAQQPAIARQVAVKLTQPPAELFFGFHIFQGNFTEALSRTEEVNVAVVEARNNAAAFQVDRARGCSRKRSNSGAAADSRDAAVPDRHCFCLRLCFVDGPDLAVHKYKVCLSPISLRGQTLRAEQEEAADADS